MSPIDSRGRTRVRMNGPAASPPPPLPMSALVGGVRCPHCRSPVTVARGLVPDGKPGTYALCERCRAVVAKDPD